MENKTGGEIIIYKDKTGKKARACQWHASRPSK
jgi:hypothetical protein